MSQHTIRRLTALCIAAVAAGTMAAAATGAAAAPGHHGPFVGTPAVGTVAAAPSSAEPSSAEPSSAEPQAQPDDEGSHFVPIQPSRTFDSRQAGRGPVHARSVLTLDYGRDQVDPRVTAITYNLTVTNTTADTYVTLYSPQGGSGVPETSSINVRRGETRANQVTVPIIRDANGIAHVSIYNNAGNADVVLDLEGAYGTGEPDSGQVYSGYEPQTPARALDTRTTGGPLAARATRTVNLQGRVPPNAVAVTVNLTAISHTTGGYLTLYPGGADLGPFSSINVQSHETTPNLVTVKLNPTQQLKLYNSAGSTDALIDVVGAFTENAGAGLYHPLPRPERSGDSRIGVGIHKRPLNPGETVTVSTPVSTEEQGKVVAVNGNLLGVGPTASTYLTTSATGTTRPNVSTLNLAPGQTSANATATASSSHGIVDIYNHVGRTDVALDISGSYVTPTVVG